MYAWPSARLVVDPLKFNATTVRTYATIEAARPGGTTSLRDGTFARSSSIPPLRCPGARSGVAVEGLVPRQHGNRIPASFGFCEGSNPTLNPHSWSRLHIQSRIHSAGSTGSSRRRKS